MATSSNDFFTEEQKMHLAQMASTYSVHVRDQESFDDYLFTIRQALTFEEATTLLAMASAVIANASAGVMNQAVAMLANMKATEN